MGRVPPAGAAGFLATVHGRVQGVGFRYATRSRAHALRLRGYVRNLPDGAVRVVCEGPPKALESMAGWLDHGPPGARVTRLDLEWRTEAAGYPSFTVEF